MTATDSSTTHPDAPRGISGKKVLLISLIACVAIPFVAFFVPVLLIESNKTPDAALDWSQRETWEIVPTRPRVLRWGDTPRPPFEGREVSELPFELSAEDASVVNDLALLAQNWDRDRRRLPTFGPPPESADFYYDYLMGRSFSVERGRNQSADRLLADAYRQAPKVLVWRFVDDAGKPLVDRNVGTIELVVVRLRDDVMDESLRLVYPDLTTDADGRVLLPVYDTVCSLGDSTRWAEGIAVEHELTRWFESPGRVGALPDAVVVERDPDRGDPRSR